MLEVNNLSLGEHQGSANDNKLSLVGMQLPEKYKEKFNSFYFSDSCIPTNENFVKEKSYHSLVTSAPDGLVRQPTYTFSPWFSLDDF
jgi:hypothetical protein